MRDFAATVPWIMQQRGGLDVLVARTLAVTLILTLDDLLARARAPRGLIVLT